MRIGAAAAVLLTALAAAGLASSSVSQPNCPRGLLPLPRNAIGPAAAAALRAVPKRDDPQVTGAVFAAHDNQRGPQARRQCGATVWRRTVVVYITRRAYLPAVSASSGVYFVGRFRGGFRVWQVVH
jgi:hypothetical protein